ncbi:MAG: hypothetical protein ACK5T0_02365 [Vampirovibrionales bacterium]|jgi:hypothetical protein
MSTYNPYYYGAYPITYTPEQVRSYYPPNFNPPVVAPVYTPTPSAQPHYYSPPVYQQPSHPQYQATPAPYYQPVTPPRPSSRFQGYTQMPQHTSPQANQSSNTGWIIAGLATVVGGVLYFLGRKGKIHPKLQTGIQGFEKNLGKGWGSVKSHAAKSWNWVRGKGYISSNSPQAQVQNASNKVQKAFQQGWDWTKDKAKDAGDWFNKTFKKKP